MDEINVIFRGSMSITSRTQVKKLKREISLAQRIEPKRRMKWSDTDIVTSPPIKRMVSPNQDHYRVSSPK
jgi:hypothetical protein